MNKFVSGFTPVKEFEKGHKSNGNMYEHVIGDVQVDDKIFVVHLSRRIGLDFEVDFLLQSVDYRYHRSLWFFGQNCPQDQFAVLAEANGQTVVATFEKGNSGAVMSVTTFKEIFSGKPVSVHETIELKKAAAAYLERDVILTDEEEMACCLERQRAKEKVTAEFQIKRAKKKGRIHRRNAKVKEILSRPKVTGFVASGSSCSGHPVVDGEWESLLVGTYVVLVGSYVEGVACDFVEQFKVGLDGARKIKVYPRPVSMTAKDMSVSGGVTNITKNLPFEIKTITVNGSDRQLRVYSTKSELRNARIAGLWGSHLVTSEDALQVDGRFEVYCAKDKGGIIHPHTVGLFSEQDATSGVKKNCVA